MKKQLEGKIISDKMHKTAVVEVVRFAMHPQYRKLVRISKKYKAHNESNDFKIGDKVIIEQCRPISKDKKWVLVKKI